VVGNAGSLIRTSFAQIRYSMRIVQNVRDERLCLQGGENAEICKSIDIQRRKMYKYRTFRSF